MTASGKHLQRDGEIVKGATRQHPHHNRVQLHNGGPKPRFGPLSPVRMSRKRPSTPYQATQDAFEPVAHGLDVEIVHVDSRLFINVHLRGQRVTPCVEGMHRLAGILLLPLLYNGQAFFEGSRQLGEDERRGLVLRRDGGEQAGRVCRDIFIFPVVIQFESAAQTIPE